MTTYRAPSKEGPIILVAGGTGGHIFPAFALAEELQGRGYTLVLVTDRRCTLSFNAKKKFSLVCVVSSGGLAGKNILRVLQGIIYLVLGLVESFVLMRKLKPVVVVGFGGYPSVPPIVAALLMGYPTVIHEQNIVLGKANRLLAPFVTKLALTFFSEKYNNSVCTGVPVRSSIRKIYVIPYIWLPQQEKVRILIIGGSQGAYVFDTVIPYAFLQLPKPLYTRIYVNQQVQSKNQANIAVLYARYGIIGELESFFEDIFSRLPKSHLVIARAGASTIAELTVSGRPAILIPYPYAIADHQTINAQAMASSGSAWLISQDLFTSESLANKLQTICMVPNNLVEAAACTRALAFPDAAKHLADIIITLI